MVRPAAPTGGAWWSCEPWSRVPLYGTVLLEGGLCHATCNAQERGALVRPELLTALALKVGDPIVIGQSTFTIRGVILNEPGRRIGGFSLGPVSSSTRRILKQRAS